MRGRGRVFAFTDVVNEIRCHYKMSNKTVDSVIAFFVIAFIVAYVVSFVTGSRFRG